MNLPTIIKKFLIDKGYFDQPLLLALSGGPDSMALFYALHQLDVSFGVAHVDHGWRAESRQEAQELQELASSLHIPFYYTRLTLPLDSSNLEDLCRQKRLHFFEQLIKEGRGKAILLGHHADDQAETVLKRALEGSSLSKLSALLPQTQRGELVLLRPFLSVSKKNILEWLSKQKISYFVDSTNEDSRFLRGRMRKDLMPQLSELFGKNIQKGLCLLAQRALEFEDYLQTIYIPLLSQIEMEEEKASLRFPQEILASSFLLEEAIKRFFSHFQISITTTVTKLYAKHIQFGKKIRVEFYKGCRVELFYGQISIDGQNRDRL